MMTSYERIKAALEHREGDRIPFDLGSTVLTGINVHCYRNLRKYLGMSCDNIEIIDPTQQLARVDEDMIERLKVDVAVSIRPRQIAAATRRILRWTANISK